MRWGDRPASKEQSREPLMHARAYATGTSEQSKESNADDDEESELVQLGTQEEGLGSAPRGCSKPITLGDDGLQGMGHADAGFEGNGSEFREARPSEQLDLRSFVRAGDILNYLGGNHWGHIVLVLATPRAIEMPILYEHGVDLMELGRDIPCYVFETLQSASNLEDIRMSSTALTVHPRTLDVCVVKEIAGGCFQICSGNDGPLIGELLLSPFNNDTLDLDLFYLTVEDLRKVPQDSKWSFRTAVRGYLRKSAIKPWHKPSNRRWLRLAKRLRRKWKVRPVCSTVPPRMWQKYLLKNSYKRFNLGEDPHVPFEVAGQVTRYQSYCCDHVEDEDEDEPDNADAAWMQDVLKVMPVMDDRVLPAELVKILIETGLWQRADLQRGPPQHRQNDSQVNVESVAAYIRRCRLKCLKLPTGVQNSDGAAMHLGTNRFNVYCGCQFKKPQQIVGRVQRNGTNQEFVEWDGKCGPRFGPQCDACCAFQEERVI